MVLLVHSSFAASASIDVNSRCSSSTIHSRKILVRLSPLAIENLANRILALLFCTQLVSDLHLTTCQSLDGPRPISALWAIPWLRENMACARLAYTARRQHGPFVPRAQSARLTSTLRAIPTAHLDPVGNSHASLRPRGDCPRGLNEAGDCPRLSLTPLG